jgi:hypothetical protein
MSKLPHLSSIALECLMYNPDGGPSGMMIRSKRAVTTFALLGAAFLGLATIGYAQGSKSVPGATVDLTTTWGVGKGTRAGFVNPGYSITDKEPEMTPWALEKYKKIREGTVPKDPERLKRVGMWDRGRENLDPSEIHCLPWGPTRLWTFDHPIEIIQTPGVVYVLFEGDHAVRRIYTDGRTHEGMYETYMGHSIGHYENNALVADTVYFNEITWLDTVGHVHSNKMHVTERFTRPEPNTMVIDFTFDDPTAYVRPWTGRRHFEALTGGKAEMLEYITCQDHLEWDHIPRLLKGLPEIVEKTP